MTEKKTKRYILGSKKMKIPSTADYTFIYPYAWSNTPRALACTVRISPIHGDWFAENRLKIKGLLVNWGRTNIARTSARIINHPKAVNMASNKRLFFDKVADLRELGVETCTVPWHTVSQEEAVSRSRDGEVILGRTERGCMGKEIYFFDDNPFRFLGSELWVRYKKKSAEYRIHIMASEIISEQQKVLRKKDFSGNLIDPNTVDFRIRSHRNGFIFKRLNLDIPPDVRRQALLAIKTAGLDFGAVDVIWNTYEQKAYVLEINTAPGLIGTTLKDYVRGFHEYFQSIRTLTPEVSDEDSS